MATSPTPGEAPKVSSLVRRLRACCCPHRLASRFSDLRASESGELTQALVGDKQTTSPGVNSANVDGVATSSGGAVDGSNCDTTPLTTTTAAVGTSVPGDLAVMEPVVQSKEWVSLLCLKYIHDYL